MKLRSIALLLFLAGAIAFAPAAVAEDEEGQPQDLKAKIKKKMEEILQLMRDNEAALLKLSTGQPGAKPKRVDVDVPETPKGSGSGSEGGSEAKGEKGESAAKGEPGAKGGESGAKGEEVARKLEELVKGTRQKGGSIPDELKQLVQMIPL